MAIEIVDFPINSMVIFHSFLYVYQRVFETNHPRLVSPWLPHLPTTMAAIR